MDESKFEKPEIKEGEMKELIEMIRERKLSALFSVVDKLEIGSGRFGPEPIDPETFFEQKDYSKIEGIVKSLLKRERESEGEKEEYTEIINAVAGLYKYADKDNEKFQGWSHSLCHLFEQYSPSSRFSSLLAPQFLETSEKLVTECVSRGLKANEAGCIDRVLSPMIDYNLTNIKTREDLNRYSLKPEILLDKSKELARLLEENDREGKISDFLVAKIPKEYILKLMEGKKKLLYIKNPEKTVEILNLIKEDISEEEINSYLKNVYGINIRDIGGEDIAETLKIMKENIEESRRAGECPEPEKLKGVFIDVEGTLIVGGKLNKKVLEEIEQEANKGRDIIIFTGGDPEKQTATLRKLGFPEKYLPVKDKKDYKGKLLQYLIDDTEPAYQGFYCSSYWLIEE